MTAGIAWVVFRENVDRRVFLGMLAIIAGSVLLSWQRAITGNLPWGSLAIAGACLCWAIDNNLTRHVSGTCARGPCTRTSSSPRRAHQHSHDFPWDGEEPHSHPHVHAPLLHSHPHFPDIHHRHQH